MSRIDQIFAEHVGAGRRTLMPFVCAGFPHPDALLEVLPALDEGGAGVIEVGFPFSDPIADGPVIAAAMHQALLQGITPERVFEQVAAVRGRIRAGLVAMVSVSIVFRTGGVRGFVSRAVGAGFDGFIFPDVPLEESGELLEACREAGASCSLLVAPTSGAERAARIAQASSGFVYVMARAGVTGERGEAPRVGPMVQAVRRATRLPVACGFGVSTAEHVREVTRHADAAIVGSALVRRLGEAGLEPGAAGMAAMGMMRELAQGLDGGVEDAGTGGF